MSTQPFTGSIAVIANNDEGFYEGDLWHYLRLVFLAPNIHHGYHGLRHMLHVLWACYEAVRHYLALGGITKREARNLLIAALFHDYDHVGRGGNDAVNIVRAIAALREHVMPEDEPYLEEIIAIIEATEFPHKDLGDSPSLSQLIVRDADISQVFGPAWIGIILAGFGSELGKTPIEMLEQQIGFLSEVEFHTDFGKVYFGERAIVAKIAETKALLVGLTS